MPAREKLSAGAERLHACLLHRHYHGGLLRGPDAARLIQRVITRDIERVAVGQMIYCCWCDEHGKVIRGVVDDLHTLKKFDEMMAPKFQEMLRKDNVLFVPNRSFTSYVDLGEIEERFEVPLVGSRALLRSEERGQGMEQVSGLRGGWRPE